MTNANEMMQILLDRVASGRLSRRRFMTIAGAAGLTAGLSPATVDQAFAAVIHVQLPGFFLERHAPEQVADALIHGQCRVFIGRRIVLRENCCGQIQSYGDQKRILHGLVGKRRKLF